MSHHMVRLTLLAVWVCMVLGDTEGAVKELGSSIAARGDSAELASSAVHDHHALHEQLYRLETRIHRHEDALVAKRATLKKDRLRNAQKVRARAVVNALANDRRLQARITDTQVKELESAEEETRSRDLGESVSEVPRVMFSQAPPAFKGETEEAMQRSKQELNVDVDERPGMTYTTAPTGYEGIPKSDGGYSIVDTKTNMHYRHPGRGASRAVYNKKAMYKLKQHHPEAGIWAGYRTPDMKREALTREGVKEEERRGRMSFMERGHEDAERAAAKPFEEVRKAFILPPPLVYKPPLMTEEEAEEAAREMKAKSRLQTFREQQAANERANKLIAAAEDGISIQSNSKYKRKINKAGIFCTPSMQVNCVELLPTPAAKLQCNTEIQLCQFEVPGRPGKFEVAEPPIRCPTGKADCRRGAARVEADYWEKAHAKKLAAAWSKASNDAKRSAFKRERHHKETKKRAAHQAQIALTRINNQLDSYVVRTARPGPGVYEPIPQLRHHDPTAELRRVAMLMRQKEGEVHTTLKKLGILTLGCQQTHGRCRKQCLTGKRSIRKDPDGSKCRGKCDSSLKTCMIDKIRRAQFAANMAKANAVTSPSLVQDLGEGENIVNIKMPVVKVSNAELAQNPNLANVAKACQDGLPASCTQLKGDLKRARKALAQKKKAIALKEQEVKSKAAQKAKASQKASSKAMDNKKNNVAKRAPPTPKSVVHKAKTKPSAEHKSESTPKTTASKSSAGKRVKPASTAAPTKKSPPKKAQKTSKASNQSPITKVAKSAAKKQQKSKVATPPKEKSRPLKKGESIAHIIKRAVKKEEKKVHMKSKLRRKAKRGAQKRASKNIKRKAKKKALAIAAKMRVKIAREHARKKASKKKLNAKTRVLEKRCLVTAKNMCEKGEPKPKTYAKDPKRSAKALKHRKMHVRKCMKRASIHCKKSVLTSVIQKNKSLVTHLTKLKSDLQPWFKAQALAHKDEKKHYKELASKKSAFSKRAKKKQGAKKNQSKSRTKPATSKKEKAKSIQQKPTSPTPVTTNAVGPDGCKNTWPDKRCDSVAAEHCRRHAVLRFKCRKSCKACREALPFFKPVDGSPIALKHGHDLPRGHPRF